MSSYNLEHVYDDELRPLIKQIMEICEKNNMPCLMAFAFAKDEESESVVTSSFNTSSHFSKRLAVATSTLLTKEEIMAHVQRL